MNPAKINIEEGEDLLQLFANEDDLNFQESNEEESKELIGVKILSKNGVVLSNNILSLFLRKLVKD